MIHSEILDSEIQSIVVIVGSHSDGKLLHTTNYQKFNDLQPVLHGCNKVSSDVIGVVEVVTSGVVDTNGVVALVVVPCMPNDKALVTAGVVVVILIGLMVRVVGNVTTGTPEGVAGDGGRQGLQDVGGPAVELPVVGETVVLLVDVEELLLDGIGVVDVLEVLDEVDSSPNIGYRGVADIPEIVVYVVFIMDVSGIIVVVS